MTEDLKKFIEETIDWIEADRWSDVAYKAEAWSIDGRLRSEDLIEFWKIVRDDLNIDILTFEDVEVVPSYYFYNSDIIDIHLPERILHISRAAFTNCKSLEKVILPASLISIGEDAFVNTSKLKKIYYNGYIEDFKRIRLDFYAFGIFNSTGKYNLKIICKDGILEI